MKLQELHPDELERLFKRLGSMMIRCQVFGASVEYLFWGYRSGNFWWRSDKHHHRCYEVCYTFAGEGIYRIGGQDIPIQPEQILIALPQEDHEVVSSLENHLGLFFWGFTLLEEDSRIPSQSNSLLDAMRWNTSPVTSAPEAMYRNLEMLTEEIYQQQLGYEEAAAALATKILLDTARAASGMLFGKEQYNESWSSQKEIVNRIEQFLREHYAEKLILSEIARQVHLSERHLTRIFRQVTHKSITEYLNDLRMTLAEQYLFRRELPIKRIAYLCGYPNVHYFINLFRKRTGMTPTRFRDGGFTWPRPKPQSREISK